MKKKEVEKTNLLYRAKHETFLKNILRENDQQPGLGAQLAFEGGTSLYLFHELPRFSTDPVSP